ncbi:MAG: single-stranded DNA-binding protein [bacterium]|nr:single-stranded DNA-binding protein [bacterium]
MAKPATLIDLSRKLAQAVDDLSFSGDVTHVYNPLRYASSIHEAYLKRYGAGTGRTLMLGMNPGPWGMAQTGVPFGEIAAVRDWLDLQGEVVRPHKEHPKRPIQGLACTRSEVSGRRLWGWAKDRWGSADHFFREIFVANYCPLVFMEESGRNRTPDRLLLAERKLLFQYCDESLRDLVLVLQAKRVVGIGRFARLRAEAALTDTGIPVHEVLHPSPASPAANRGWADQATRQLEEIGVL